MERAVDSFERSLFSNQEVAYDVSFGAKQKSNDTGAKLGGGKAVVFVAAAY